MKHIIFLLIFPFVVKAQTSVKINPYSESPKKEAWEKIEGYRQQVLKGESMSALANKYSEDPGSSKAGGCYKNIERGTMVPEFENAAYSLKPGEVSEVFETQYGFHFVQLLDRRGNVIDVRHILIVPKS